MDRPTFEALQRIMELIQPRSGAPAELREDWHRVASWMQEAAREIDNLRDARHRRPAARAAGGAVGWWESNFVVNPRPPQILCLPLVLFSSLDRAYLSHLVAVPSLSLPCF